MLTFLPGTGHTTLMSALGVELKLFNYVRRGATNGVLKKGWREERVQKD